MTYEILDNDELLRLALEAMNGAKDADALVILKTLVEREPGNAPGQYLLAAQHAQLGLMDRAEAGFKAALAGDLEIPLARFQLGQLLLLKGDMQEAQATLGPLASGDEPALAAYARALIGASREDVAAAQANLREGLALPQSSPALAEDMQRLLLQIDAAANEGSAMAESATTTAPASSLYLSNYGRYN